jgi:hypothetical protein
LDAPTPVLVKLRASPAVLSVSDTAQYKLDEEKSKHAGLVRFGSVQENGFGSVYGA